MDYRLGYWPGSGVDMPGRELSACYAGNGMKLNFFTKSYLIGLQDCIMMIRRGVRVGLTLQDSVDAAEKAIKKAKRRISNENHLPIKP